jgi:hypothetical protein
LPPRHTIGASFALFAKVFLLPITESKKITAANAVRIAVCGIPGMDFMHSGMDGKPSQG